MAVNQQVSGLLLIVLVFLVTYLANMQDFAVWVFLRGLYSSLSLGFLWFLLTSVFSKKVSGIFNIVLVFLLAFNTSHILVNASHMNFSHYGLAFNSSFIDSIVNPSFFRLLFYIFTAWLCCLWLSRLHHFNLNLKIVVPIAILLCLLDFFLPHNVAYSNWSQRNILISNFDNFKSPALILKSKGHKKKIHIQNLNGVKFLTGQKKITKPNIVLLFLEGFSQKYVELGLAPEIKKIQDEGITVRNFITNQLQTNRGLYSSLCADYPNLISFEAKSDLMNSSDFDQKCLPHALKKLGYEGYFLQSAFLSFMRKDLFAKNAGYDFAVGADSFSPEHIISSWGIPDNLLIESVYKVLVEKTDQKKPKFISALTSGTHHPFITPYSSGDLPKAIQYTDHVIGKFYQALKDKGHLDNTLLVITTDEAKTLSPRFPDIYSHWGLLTFAGSGLKKQTVEKIFSQVDLTNSILDFLGEAESFDFSGKSIFRRYQENSSIFMGNIYSKRILMTMSEKSFLLCDYNFNCAVKEGDKNLFAANYSVKSANPEEMNNLKGFLFNNEVSFSDMKGRILFEDSDIVILKKRAYGVLEEFKTTPEVNQHLRYRVEYEGSISIPVEYSFYACGDPSTIHKFKSVIKEAVQSISLTIPSHLRKRNLCHSFFILNETNKDFKLKSVQLIREPI